MTWVAVSPPAHVCAKPSLGHRDMKTYGPDSTWVCDDCGATWTITRWSTATNYEGLTPEWRQLT